MWAGVLGMLMQAALSGPAVDDQAEQLRRSIVSECSATDGEIVVCGRRDGDRYRLRSTAVGPDDVTQPGSLGLTLAPGARISAEAEQRTLLNGMSAPALMIKLKTRF